MLLSLIRRFCRIYHTIQPMMPVQWCYLVYYRLLRKRIPSCTVPSGLIHENLNLVEAPALDRSRLQDKSFVFLNEVSAWHWDAIDWSSADRKKLWRYNLHYFDWLREPEPQSGLWHRIMQDWIANVDYGEGDGWEPYPLSLRMVNWIKWLWKNPDEVESTLLISLYQQGFALEKQVEYHIQANHLYKNAIALIYLGCFFSGKTAQRWFDKGLTLWQRETRRQFLADGGHVEKSPLYHALCLEDLLDVINVLKAKTYRPLDNELMMIASNATQWLSEMVDPDGHIVLLNDSAQGISSGVAELKCYARRLGVHLQPDPVAGVVHLAASGYLRYQNERFRLIFDCGDIGPEYQPGHTHCDMLSFLLWYQDKPLFIDCGVGSYLDDEHRRYARSTAAHNTLMIENKEQSDIWSAFRVGRRARIVRAEIQSAFPRLRFCGAHQGYSRFWRDTLHTRTLDLYGNQLAVMDHLSGSSEKFHDISIFYHLAEYHRVVIEQNYCDVLGEDGQRIARILVPHGLTATVKSRSHFPEFGLVHSHCSVELTGHVIFPFEATTVITFY